MTAVGNSLKTFTEQLSTVCQNRATGQLIINGNGYQGHVSLLAGRLLYTRLGVHPNRRWERVTQKICPDWSPQQPDNITANLWEYQLLHHAITTQQLTVVQAKSIIKMVAQEVFFDLGCYSDYTIEWQEGTLDETELALSLSLSYLEIEPEIANAIQMLKQWHGMGLGNLSPTLAPMLTNDSIDLSSLGGFKQFLGGQYTLWDISTKLEKPVTLVTKALIPLLKKRVVQFKKVQDLPNPLSQRSGVVQKQQPPAAAVAAPKKDALIACIDDSPVVLQTLKKILEGSGYRTFAITEPMRGIADLIENQPDLIFLDLVMPNASGYSVCKFLRQTSVFEKIPIIVLTSRDTLIDRNRARLSGASDFLGKPPDPEKTIKLVEKYLA